MIRFDLWIEAIIFGGIYSIIIIIPCVIIAFMGRAVSTDIVLNRSDQKHVAALRIQLKIILTFIF